MSDQCGLESVLSKLSLGRGRIAVFIDFQAAELEFPAVLGHLPDDALIGGIGGMLTPARTRGNDFHAI